MLLRANLSPRKEGREGLRWTSWRRSATSICCTRSSRTARSCTARLRHQAFQSEIRSSKERLDKIKSYNDIDSFARDIGSQTQTKPTEVLNNLTSVIASSWASWTTGRAALADRAGQGEEEEKQQQVVNNKMPQPQVKKDRKQLFEILQQLLYLPFDLNFIDW